MNPLKAKIGLKNVGFITSTEAKLTYYFPTVAEPNLIPTEPPFTPDDQIVIDVLRNMGANVEHVIWGEKNLQKLKQFDLLVMRSPWDYMDSRENKKLFIDWLGFLQENQISIENNIDFMLWLINKKYLKDLEKQDIKIIPTSVIDSNQITSLEKIFIDSGPLVIKPACSASGLGLQCVETLEKAKDFQEEFNSLIAQESYLIQPLIEDIKIHGEWSLIFIDGNYSHSVHKKPGKDSILSHAECGGSLSFSEASDILIRYSESVLSKILLAFQKKFRTEHNYTPLYLRCDFIEHNGEYLLSECEGVEPELFFRAKAESAIAFAKKLMDKYTNL